MASNAGGYIRIEAGDSNNDTGDAGYVEIRGGQTSGGTPGYVNIQGGYNSSGLGGDVALISGYGTTGYGNVVINTTGGINLWTFDKDGNLILPNTGGYSYISSSAQIQLNANGQIWAFGTDGVLTLPAGGDIKNSSGVSVLGGGGSTGTVTFVDNVIQGEDRKSTRLNSSHT